MNPKRLSPGGGRENKDFVPSAETGGLIRPVSIHQDHLLQIRRETDFFQKAADRCVRFDFQLELLLCVGEYLAR